MSDAEELRLIFNRAELEHFAKFGRQSSNDRQEYALAAVAAYARKDERQKVLEEVGAWLQGKAAEIQTYDDDERERWKASLKSYADGLLTALKEGEHA